MHSFPFKIGYDVAGTITETGKDVTEFQVGDAVYITLPEVNRGMNGLTSISNGDILRSILTLSSNVRILQSVRGMRRGSAWPKASFNVL